MTYRELAIEILKLNQGQMNQEVTFRLADCVSHKVVLSFSSDILILNPSPFLKAEVIPLSNLYRCTHCNVVVNGNDKGGSEVDSGSIDKPRASGDHNHCCDICCYDRNRCSYHLDECYEVPQKA